MPVTKAQAKKIVLAFPGALEKSSYGRPAFFIEKKFFTRIRDEDNSIIMRVDGIEQRDMMLELDPETYFITDHYKDWPGLLVRISKITPAELKTMLERRWRQIAPKRLVREFSSPVHGGGVPRSGTEGARAAQRSLHDSPSCKSASAKRHSSRKGRKTTKRK